MDASRLTRIKLFAQLPSHEREYVAAWATELSAPAGTVLMREQDFAYDLLMILEGTAEVHHSDQVLAELGPGDIVGEIGFVTRGLRSATVTATAPLLAIRLSRWELRRLEVGAPIAAQAIKQLATERELQAA